MRTTSHPAVLGTFMRGMHAIALSRHGYALAGRSTSAHLVVQGVTHELAHLGAVTSLAFSPDTDPEERRWLATGSSDMGVRVFDQEGRCLHLLKGHMHDVRGVAWLDDGLLASASVDGSVRAHRIGPQTASLEWVRRALPSSPRHLAIQRSAANPTARLVLGTDDRVLLLDEQGRPLHEASTFYLSGLCANAGLVGATHVEHVSHNSKVHHVTIFDEALGTLWTGEGTCVAIDESGAVAVVQGESLTVHRFDDDERSLVFDIQPHDAAIAAVCAAPGGWVTGGHDGSSLFVDERGVVRGGVSHSNVIGFVAACEDRRLAVSHDANATLWTAGDTAPVCRAARVDPVRSIEIGGAGNAVAFDLECAALRFAVSTTSGLEVHDATERVAVLNEGVETWGALFSAGLLGTRLGQDRSHALWDATSLASIGEIPGFYLPNVSGRAMLTDELACYRIESDPTSVVQLAAMEGDTHSSTLSPDGRFAWLAGEKGLLVDITSGETTVLLESLERGRAAFSPQSDRLLVSNQNTVHLLHVDSRQSQTLEVGPLWSIAWSPTGHHFALGTPNHQIYVYDTDGVRVGAIEREGYGGYVNPVFLPDGRRLVAGSQRGPGGLFELDGTEVAALDGLASDFVWAEVLEDRILTRASVSPCPDMTLQLWSFDGERVATMPGHHGERWWQVNVSPCKKWIVSVVWGDWVRVWSAEDGSGSILPIRGAVRGAQFSAPQDEGVWLCTADETHAHLFCF